MLIEAVYMEGVMELVDYMEEDFLNPLSWRTSVAQIQNC